MFRFLFDNNAATPQALLFEQPFEIIRADEPDEVAGALTRLNAVQKSGLYAAGYFSFEMAFALEPKLHWLMPERRNAPLLQFGVFQDPVELDTDGVDAWLSSRSGGHRVGSVEPALTASAYALKFDRALKYIASGDIYQLNLTFKANFGFEGSPASLFRELRRKQPVPYGAFVETDDFSLLSLSPELFLESDGKRIMTRPMKGTSRRGLTMDEDDALKVWLASDVKSRAENLMIVDLMRNDLSRIAEPGSVGVPDIFTVETFETVLQMTSGVEATLKPNAELTDIARALFPPGSITGAPKIRAIEIIRELEDEPRGVYCGAIGIIKPHAGFLFNVAIRTLHIGPDGQGEVGIGSGLVQDSDAQAEYDECLLKLKFLTQPSLPAFELIETLKWERDGGYVLLDRHLRRLRSSAQRFGYAFDRTSLTDALDAHARSLASANERVRLTLNKAGAIKITSTSLPAAPQRVMSYALAHARMEPCNIFLYHKTTHRAFYDDERLRLAAETGCDEALFLNIHGELTEGSFTNVFLEIGGELLTPALSCGLLPGTLRQDLIERGEAREAMLTLRDLERAEAVWFGNSVRGLVRAVPVAEQATRAPAA